MAAELPLARERPQFAEVLPALNSRWQAYEAAEVDVAISPRDDMYENGKLDGYLAVGRSAMEIISEAMSSQETFLTVPLKGDTVILNDFFGRGNTPLKVYSEFAVISEPG